MSNKKIAQELFAHALFFGIIFSGLNIGINALNRLQPESVIQNTTHIDRTVPALDSSRGIVLVDLAQEQKPTEVNFEPIPEAKSREIVALTTAYSEFDSCHYAGCIMASGKKAYVGAVACPREILLGTEISIDGKKLICEDRTNKNLNGRFDIFTGYGESSHRTALKYGKQSKVIKVYENQIGE